MNAQEQLKVVDDKIQSAIDYARDELEINYASLIGLLYLHIAHLAAESMEESEEEES